MEFYLIQDWLLVNGEDAQVTVFFSFLGLFILVERILAFRSPAQDKRKRWMTNLGLSVTTIAVLPITPVSLITAGAWAQQNNIGLMNQVSLPIFLAVVVQLLALGLSEVRDGCSDDFLWLLASPVKTFAQAQTRPIQD